MTYQFKLMKQDERLIMSVLIYMKRSSYLEIKKIEVHIFKKKADYMNCQSGIRFPTSYISPFLLNMYTGCQK